MSWRGIGFFCDLTVGTIKTIIVLSSHGPGAVVVAVVGRHVAVGGLSLVSMGGGSIGLVVGRFGRSVRSGMVDRCGGMVDRRSGVGGSGSGMVNRCGGIGGSGSGSGMVYG